MSYAESISGVTTVRLADRLGVGAVSVAATGSVPTLRTVRAAASDAVGAVRVAATGAVVRLRKVRAVVSEGVEAVNVAASGGGGGVTSRVDRPPNHVPVPRSISFALSRACVAATYAAIG